MTPAASRTSCLDAAPVPSDKAVKRTVALVELSAEAVTSEMVSTTPLRGTVKLLPLVPVPLTVMTLTGPVKAWDGTTAVMDVAVAAVTDAAILLKVTVWPDSDGMKFVPVIVTTVPGDPLDGEKPDTVGVGDPAVLQAIVGLSIVLLFTLAVSLTKMKSMYSPVVITSVSS